MQDSNGSFGGNSRILIVEDNADINRLIYKILKKSAYFPEMKIA